MRKLTEKEQGFVKDIAKGKSMRQAVLNNYNVKNLDGTAPMADNIKKRPAVMKKLLSIADSIPDELLIRKHLELLNKKEKITKNNMTTGEIEVIDTGEIDAHAVKAGLDMAYKIKSTYAAEKQTHFISTDDEARAKANDILNSFVRHDA